MSSDEDSPPNSAHNRSRVNLKLHAKRLHRSCDFCRHRKSDGYQMPDGCFNCLTSGSPCTYLQPARKRGPKDKLVEELRKKNASLEAKLRSLSICSLCAQPLKSRPDQNSPSTSASEFPQSSSERIDTNIATEAEHPFDEDDFLHVELADRFRTLSIKTTEDKFFGSSSSFVLVSSTMAAKEKYLGRRAVPKLRRPLFWEILPWEKEAYDQRPRYVYPLSDLIAALLDLYFKNVHPILPVLHRPSFEQSVAEGLYLKDTQFGAVLLAVLGVASRYSNDPRVLVDTDASLSAGWKFVKQVQVVRKLFEPTLYDVQFYCLITLFSCGTSAPQGSWLYLGLGIRALQQRGAHRRIRKERALDPKDQSLLYLDRLVSLFSGRPAGIHPEDYDVDLPLEVDDEYWEHGFTQPLGKPSLLSYFVCQVRLCEILGDALRRLYASSKLKALMGWSGPEWEQRAVAELDSAMNSWFDSLPTHLRWDPDRTPDVFFHQSAVLYTTYYYIQIAIHRQFIHKATVLASPSLSISTSAARSALHIADVWLKKVRRLPPELMYMNSVFVSGVILLLNMFATKRAGLSIDKNRDLEFLKFAESRWQPAGRLWELLQELKSLDGPLPVKWTTRNEFQHTSASASKIERTTVSRETPSSLIDSAGTPQHEFYPTHRQSVEEPPEMSFEQGPEHLWDMPSNQSLPLPNDPETAIYLEQLLADTAEFDTMNLSTANGFSDSSQELANSSILDDELASLWMAAPTDFAGINQWDAYLEIGMMD
ncbi:fungal-specific transcription factor domain-containing protein [Mycena latifolia]|nr:fungal-specific transcription factor domain-containing protein [Mycena latifolia]